MDTPEFSRCYRLDDLGATPVDVKIESDLSERAALATRFGLIAIDMLRANAHLLIRDKHPIAEGQFSAKVVQACVATGEPVPATLKLPFKVRFVDEQVAPQAEEVELSFDDYDEMPLSDETIDLGEAVAQSMALALDPFPRSPNADHVLREAGVVVEGEETRGAFAALKDLLK